MTPMLEGGCACGAIRYRVPAEPFDVSHCHCTICRRHAGAPFVTWLTVPAADFTLLSGTPRARRASVKAVRTFCGDCGTPLTFTEEARPNSIDVTAGSLDEPERIAPIDHTYVATKLRWIHLADGLPEHPETNPSERDVDPG